VLQQVIEDQSQGAIRPHGAGPVRVVGQPVEATDEPKCQPDALALHGQMAAEQTGDDDDDRASIR
jgi:hypothetical protein